MRWFVLWLFADRCCARRRRSTGEAASMRAVDAIRGSAARFAVGIDNKRYRHLATREARAPHGDALMVLSVRWRVLPSAACAFVGGEVYRDASYSCGAVQSGFRWRKKRTTRPCSTRRYFSPPWVAAEPYPTIEGMKRSSCRAIQQTPCCHLEGQGQDHRALRAR
jgi:hypothetical protein